MGYPVISVSEDHIYVVWDDSRINPDTNTYGGIYFSGWEEEVSVNDDIDIPDQISLIAYPNPFNSTTIISYSNLEGGEIEIYNIQGQKITILNTQNNEEGQIKWDATDASGERVSSGIYFAKARTSKSQSTIKLIYLR